MIENSLMSSDEEFDNQLDDAKTFDDYLTKQLPKINANTKSLYRKRWDKMNLEVQEEDLFSKIRVIAQTIADQFVGGKVTYAAFRQNRAAYYFGLSTLATNEGFQKTSVANGLAYVAYPKALYAYLKTIKSKSVVSTGALNPVIKIKEFPIEIYNWLIAYSPKRPNSIHELLKLFIEANTLIGLRPSEWIGCRFARNIKSREWVIVVENGQSPNGLANGSTRTLILNGATRAEKTLIQNTKEALECDLNQFYKEFKKKIHAFENPTTLEQKNKNEILRKKGQLKIEKQLGAGKTWNPVLTDLPLEDIFDKHGNVQLGFVKLRMNQLQRKLAKILADYPLLDSVNSDQKIPSIYSTRNQAVANAKGSMSPLELAAFFGHNSLETAKRRFGEAYPAVERFKFRPDPETVCDVEKYLIKNLEPIRQIGPFSMEQTKLPDLDFGNRHSKFSTFR